MYSSGQSDMSKDVRGRESSQQGLPNLNEPGLFRTLLNALNQGYQNQAPGAAIQPGFLSYRAEKHFFCTQYVEFPPGQTEIPARLWSLRTGFGQPCSV